MTSGLYKRPGHFFVLFLSAGFLLVAGLHAAFAQKQLLLLKNENVLLRLNPGDEFVFKMKGTDNRIVSYINNLSDTAVVLHRDTVPFHTIERIYFYRPTFLNRLGPYLVIGGGFLLLIDQFNHAVVQGNEARLDKGVTVTSACMVAAGLPMMLIRKKYQRIGGRKRLMMAQPGSPFYFDNRPKGYISPMLPEN